MISFEKRSEGEIVLALWSELEPDLDALDEMIKEITFDAYGDDEKLWAFRQAFEDNVELPADGFVIGEPVSVIEDREYEKLSNYTACEGQMDLKTLKEAPPWEWPEGADKMLLEILADDQDDASDRILAAELAGDFTVINDELVDALLSILQDNNELEELRGKAAISLGPVLEHADTDGFDDPDDVPISEDTFRKIQESLHRLYLDTAVPKNVRRRILEASVRALQDWHQDAIRAAYSSDDEDWGLTAVFSMRWVRGFDNQILEALENNNQDIHYQSICAAGNWEADAAWSHVTRLISAQGADKPLLLAAIDAVASIRPQEAGVILVDLTDSDDEDIVEAAHEAMAMAGALSGDEFDDV